METVSGYLLFLILVSLTAFAAWGVLYISYLFLGIVLVAIKGVLEDRKLSESLNGDLEPGAKDLLALIMSCATAGVAFSIWDWSPVEIGLCVAAIVFYLQIREQTEGSSSIATGKKDEPSSKEETYRVTDLGKPLGEMTPEERRAAAEKLAENMLNQIQQYERKKDK